MYDVLKGSLGVTIITRDTCIRSGRDNLCLPPVQLRGTVPHFGSKFPAVPPFFFGIFVHYLDIFIKILEISHFFNDFLSLILFF